jgi:integrase
MIKHVHFVRKRLASGGCRWYVYAWRGGPQIMADNGQKKPKLSSEALKLLTEAEVKRAKKPAPDTGTFGALIREWRASPEWKALKPNTRKTWGSILNQIEKKWSKAPLLLFNDTRIIKKIVDWRNSRAATPRAADNGITVLRALLKHGMQDGQLQMNAAANIGKLYKGGQRAEIIWTEDDLEACRKVAAAEDQPVIDAIEFASVTGLRREDLATLTWKSVDQFAIVTVTTKESAGDRLIASIPRIPQLNGVLEQLAGRSRKPGVNTLLVTNKGEPWNLDTLTREVTRIAKKANVVHVDNEEIGAFRRKHLHDLRGTFATRLMTTTRLSNEDVADIMGWSVKQVAKIRKMYVSDHARTVALGKQIAHGFEADLRPSADPR